MIKSLLKLLFAISLLYWLIHSGKLDLTLIQKSFYIGPQWLIAILLIALQASLAAFRYRILLQTKSQNPLRYFDIYWLNYIGFFFSSVLPGAVTGDLIKLVYIKKLDSHFSKTFLITSTIIDRIMGLTGLLFLSGFFSLIYYQEVTGLSSQMSHVIKLNLLLFLGAIVFLSTLMAPVKMQNAMIAFSNKAPIIGKKLHHFLEQVFSFRENRLGLLKCFLLSVMIQTLAIIAFWIISSPFTNGHLPLPYAFTLIPVGFIATAIPISPGGLGVGHVLFSNLFNMINITNGASLFNLFFLCNFAHNFLGLIPYLLAGKKAGKQKT